MYHKLLVPVDGSELAECILPHVESIARSCGAKDVIFVRVAEPIVIPLGGYEGFGTLSAEEFNKLETASKDAAGRYLAQLVGRVKYDGVNITSEVVAGGPVADVIADFATKNKIDLIVISTHGRSGISRWVWGSVADRILRSACVPVLIVRAPGCVSGI